MRKNIAHNRNLPSSAHPTIRAGHGRLPLLLPLSCQHHLFPFQGKGLTLQLEAKESKKHPMCHSLLIKNPELSNDYFLKDAPDKMCGVLVYKYALTFYLTRLSTAFPLSHGQYCILRTVNYSSYEKVMTPCLKGGVTLLRIHKAI